MRNTIHWIKHQIKWQFKSMVAWSLILGVFSIFIGWAYKPFSESGYFEMLQQLPDYMRNSFLGEGGGQLVASLDSFLALEYFSWMGLTFAFYAFIVGAAAIAGEIEERTYDPLVSKPFSRYQFYWGKYFVFTVNAIILVAFNFLCLSIGLKFSNAVLANFTWIKLFGPTVLAVLVFLSFSHVGLIQSF